jgi:lysozyme
MEGLQELKAGTHPYMRDLQRAQEGLRLEAYECSAGKWSIGYGRNLEVKGREADYRRYAGTGRQITGEQAEKWLAEDLSVAYRELEKNFGSERWFQDLSVNRKIALTSMSFNLGLPTLRKFEEMFAELRAGDFKGAARESLDSKWAGQVGTPAQGVAYILEHDTLPDLKVALANQGLR